MDLRYACASKNQIVFVGITCWASAFNFKFYQNHLEFQKECWPLSIYRFPIHPLQLSLSAIQSTCLIQKGKFDNVHK